MDQRTALMTSRAYLILIVFVHCLHTLGLQRGQQLSLIPWEKSPASTFRPKETLLRRAMIADYKGLLGWH